VLSPCGLRNTISGGLAIAQHFYKECRAGAVSGHIPSRNPERDSDQGTQFMSITLRERYGLLGIKSIRTSVYHSQTDGLVERLNKTLKSMIRKCINDDERNWNKWLDSLLFAVWEVPQAYMGFSPFELLFGRTPRGLLDLSKDNWEEGLSIRKSNIQHVLDLRSKLHTLGRVLM